jgi:hypothetical protein
MLVTFETKAHANITMFGEVAVTLIDVDQRCPEATLTQLRAIEGVLSVRCLGN